MNKSLITGLSALSLAYSLFADDLILVPNAQGIILSGDSQQLPLNVVGVIAVDIDLPGTRENLEKRLLPLFMEKNLTAEDIGEIKREIVRYYRDHDRSIMAIQIPEQDVTDGVLTFVITEGKLGDVSVVGNHYFSKDLIKNYIKLKPGECIDDHVLVNNVAFINRNPFRHADLVYSPGKEVGTTDIEVYVKDAFPLRAYVGVDNTGVLSTGRLRLFSGFNWGKAFGLDHIMSFQYTTSSDFYKFQGYTLSYTALLPWENTLLFYGGYSGTHVSFGTKNEQGNRHKTHGNSLQVSFRYGIPMKPKFYLLHEINVGYDFKRTNNTFEMSEQDPIIGSNVNLTQFVLEYNFGYERGIQKIGFDGELFISPFSWIPNQSSMDFHSLNPHAKPQYAYLLAACDYAITMPMKFMWKLFFEAQVATGSLLPSEQFGLGGYNTVRGYNERQVNSDEGLLVTTEFWSPSFSPSLGLLNDALQFLVFLDYGLGHDIDKIHKVPQTQWLMGIGPGLRYAIGSTFSSRLDFGFKINRDHYEGGIGMLHFSLVGSY
ncbi:MAG: ShlB/FhaC/HecB family hemolysin secretion/activation protein [Chlamydiota bacterium]